MFFDRDMLEKRKYHRFDCDESVHYQHKESLYLEGSKACNISESGIKIKAGEFLPKDTILSIRMKLNPASSIIDLRANVIWSERISYADQYYIGLEFVQPSLLFKKEVNSYINSPRN